MIQEIIALSIVFFAVLYTVKSSWLFFKGEKKSGCTGQCGSCQVKAQVVSANTNKLKKQQLTFNPKDFQLN